MSETHDIMTVLEGVSGTAFVSIDTLTEETLFSRISSLSSSDQLLCKVINSKKNPMLGRIFKRLVGNSVIVFTSSAGYKNMVKRRLDKEGKDENEFVVKPPIWGSRINDTPIIEHNGEYYLECIFQKSGVKSYMGLVGDTGKLEEIDKDLIIGLKPPAKIADSAQAYLENMVIIRRFKLKSITGIRFNDQEFTGDFVYTPPVSEEKA